MVKKPLLIGVFVSTVLGGCGGDDVAGNVILPPNANISIVQQPAVVAVCVEGEPTLKVQLEGEDVSDSEYLVEWYVSEGEGGEDPVSTSLRASIVEPLPGKCIGWTYHVTLQLGSEGIGSASHFIAPDPDA